MNRICTKIACVMSISAMLLGSGCSSSGEAKMEQPRGTETTNKVKTYASELRVSVFDRNTSGYVADNNFQTKWIQDNFGNPNNIKVTFVPIPRFEEVDRLKVLMAANQAPDICFTYSGDLVKNYALNGSLTDLGGLLDSHAPNLKEYLGEDLLSLGRWNDTQYSVPSKRLLQAAVSTFIRKDWLDELNLPVPQTKEEFYNTLKAFKEKDPGNLGEENIPFSFSIDSNNILWSVYTIVYGFLEPMTDEQRAVLPFWQWPGFKEGMRYLNRLYNEGLADKNFVTNIDGKQQLLNISEGKVGAFINTFDLPYRSPDGMLSILNRTNPLAQIIPIDPFENYEGKHPKMIYNPGGFYIFVPKSSERAAEAVKYLEWMSDPDVLFFLQHGEKGVHYTEEKDGIPTKVVPMDQIADEKKANFIDLAIIVNGNEFGDEEKNKEAASFGYPGYEELYKQAYDIAMTDGVNSIDTYVDASNKHSSALKDMNVEIFVKSITCKKEQFDKTYDSLIEKYLEIGGQEVIDEKRAIYNQQQLK